MCEAVEGWVVWANITDLEMNLTKLQDKETLTEKEQHTVSIMVKQLEALSAELKTQHYTIVDQIEDQNILTKEQEVVDDCEDKVKDLMEHLEDLLVTTEPEIPHTFCMGDH